eukprot:7344237-Prymnesium_polylepis.1
MVGVSFDGASVMLGQHRGTVAKLQEMAKHLVALHAAAHVTQLANLDSFQRVAYYVDWRGIVQRVYILLLRLREEAIRLALQPDTPRNMR